MKSLCTWDAVVLRGLAELERGGPRAQNEWGCWIRNRVSTRVLDAPVQLCLHIVSCTCVGIGRNQRQAGYGCVSRRKRSRSAGMGPRRTLLSRFGGVCTLHRRQHPVFPLHDARIRAVSMWMSPFYTLGDRWTALKSVGDGAVVTFTRRLCVLCAV